MGVGLNSVFFALFHAFFLAPLPGMRDDSRLIWLDIVRDGGRGAASYAEFQEIASATRSELAGGSAGLAAFSTGVVSIGLEPAAEPVGAAYVSPGYFPVLGARARAGRLLGPEDDVSPATGGAPVAVISGRLSDRRFGADSAALGSRMKIGGGGADVVIVGVMADGFAGPVFGVTTDVWMPLSLHGVVNHRAAGLLENRQAEFLHMAALIREPKSAIAVEAGALAALERTMRRTSSAQGRRHGVRLTPIRDGLRSVQGGPGSAALPLALVSGALAVLVLLIVATNVGGLLLARSLARRREFAVRSALGVSRGRLVRQLVAETAVPWIFAGVAAFALASAAGALANAAVDLPANVDLAPAPVVLFATLLLAFVSGIVFGIAPAVHATRGDLVAALKDDPAGGWIGRSRGRGAFLIAQLAASLMLLALTGQVLASVADTAEIDPGFEPTRAVLAVFVSPERAGIPQDRAPALLDAILARVSTYPGVLAASAASTIAFGPTAHSVRAGPSGTMDAMDVMDVQYSRVRPGFFRATGTKLIRGRDVTASDARGTPRVVVVNETLARRFWPDQNPVGQRLSLEGDRDRSRAFEVIGVARDGKYGSLSEPPAPYIYFSDFQDGPAANDAVILVRMASPADLHAGAILRDVLGVEPRLAGTVRHATLEAHLASQLAPRRRAALFIAAFGGFALILASIGVYAAVLQFVQLRTREFGTRLALGAPARHVLTLVLSQGLRLAGLGVLIGGIGAIFVTRGIGVAVLGVVRWNPMPLLLASAVLLICVVAASWVPARRAMRIGPLAAIRAGR